ncbi:MAG: acyl-CoA thioester hydrolase [Oleispira sp.]|jgi:acyl-CoA thioester hydrolase
MNKATFDWQYSNPYLQDIRVKAEDTDKLGHTNNVRYLEWLESISWQHIEVLGCGWDLIEQLGKAMAIVRTEIDYINASYENEALCLATWITSSDMKLQSSRHFQLVRLSDQKLILKAKMNFVCISLKSGKPAKMSKEIIEAHELGMQQSSGEGAI